MNDGLRKGLGRAGLRKEGLKKGLGKEGLRKESLKMKSLRKES